MRTGSLGDLVVTGPGRRFDSPACIRSSDGIRVLAFNPAAPATQCSTAQPRSCVYRNPRGRGRSARGERADGRNTDLRACRGCDDLGHDVDAPLLPERGTADMRVAIQAFNAMQSRLRAHMSKQTHMLAAISHDLQALSTTRSVTAVRRIF